MRCHLHYLAGRAEERLTFDLQPEIARRMGFRDRSTLRAVERFMKRYYLVARDVGALTRIVCAALEEKHQRRPRFALPRLGLGRRRVGGFVIQGGRVGVEDPELFARQPVRMLELFRLAQERDLDVHPAAVAAVGQNLRHVDQAVRQDPEANRLFLDVLCSRKDPALTLGRMNEAGLLGRFVPDFGRIVGQMQHNLYHVYTVDEHTIRAIGVLADVERGGLVSEMPLVTELAPKLLSRRELYVATFLHDLGKGRPGDHSVVGEAIAKRLCPRLGLSDEATETVAWLVRQHLVLSNTAFRRDPDDPKTVADLVGLVQSPERLRLLLMLTVADIRAVGPDGLERLEGPAPARPLRRGRLGDGERRPAGQARAAGSSWPRSGSPRRLKAAGWTAEAVEAYVARHDPRYWLGFSGEEHLHHARLVREADDTKAPLALDFRVDEFRARTELVLYAADHPGLFMKVAGALALSGASIVDARIFTTSDGMALDVLGFQDASEQSRAHRHGPPRAHPPQRREGAQGRDLAREAARRPPHPAEAGRRVRGQAARAGRQQRLPDLQRGRGQRPRPPRPAVRRRQDAEGPAASSSTARTSATYGERVVDVFYIKDVFGLKVTQAGKVQRLERTLLDVLRGTVEAAPAAAAPAPAG